MICITGVPGSGKSTICKEIVSSGYDCRNVLDLNGAASCLEDDEMDIDCLKEHVVANLNDDAIVEGHYSHLLGCSIVFIIEREEDLINKTLIGRGYPPEKIDENLDALRSDIIYQEALEFLPASRIHRIQVDEGNPGYAAKKIIQLMGHAKKD